MLVKDLRIEGVQDGGVTIAWKSPIEGESIVQQLRQPMYEVRRVIFIRFFNSYFQNYLNNILNNNF